MTFATQKKKTQKGKEKLQVKHKKVLLAIVSGKKTDLEKKTELTEKHIKTHTHTHTYIYIRVCVCVYIYIYIYMHSFIYETLFKSWSVWHMIL